MRIAKGIKENLTIGYTQEYLQLFQYDIQGLYIRVDNPPTTASVNFEFYVNNVLQVNDTILEIPIANNYIDYTLPTTIVVNKGDVLRFECTNLSDLNIGNSIYFGIY